MKKTFFLLVLGLFCLLPLSVFAIDFKINSYQGDLYIHADNTAEFRQKIVYQFEEDFKGQIVGLGRAGKMPSGLKLILSQRLRHLKMVIKSKILLAK